ncbi:hypothetical protein NA78x_003390 [Anatilimnocola sp. NA78]|uniref:hypothetical protein n=1 Tax=Anatilimnocola sp. NA78 TaxID=3415683 RepID=UPI003CE45F2A
MKSIRGREYKSQMLLFGVPLVHIATGRDPATGKKRIAKGVIAVGNIAVGFLAIGGVAVGGLTIGGVSLGLISLGGLSIGALVALGGCALGGGLSAGGFAVSAIAAGGMAVGYFAIGGGAAGMHTVSAMGVDPVAKQLLQPWLLPWNEQGPLLAIFCPTASLITSLILLIVFLVRSSGPAEEHLSYFVPPHERKVT